jgi:hypothetical protein
MTGVVLLLANIPLVTNWVTHHGFADWDRHIRVEYLLGMAVITVVVPLILLVSPRSGAFGRKCPLGRHELVGSEQVLQAV